MGPKSKITENQQYTSAIELEKEKRYSEAVKIYESIVSGNPLNIDAHNRLMVLYRKLKDSAKELRTINRAVKAYQQKIESDQKLWIKSNREKAELSKQLASSLGMLNEKGQPAYENETLSKWKVRLSRLKERMAKAKLKTKRPIKKAVRKK